MWHKLFILIITIQWGLQINFGKTEYLTLDPGAEIVTETGQIKAVNKFIYLESILEATGATTLEIEKKKLMYQALVQSILLYVAETWTLNTQQANKLLATEMDFWRSATKSRKEKV
jgi:chromosome condensin MukBEF complex kleisin-like MukF subunit